MACLFDWPINSNHKEWGYPLCAERFLYSDREELLATKLLHNLDVHPEMVTHNNHTEDICNGTKSTT